MAPEISVEERYMPINRYKWLPGDAVPRDFGKFKAILDNTVSSSGKTLERTLALERNQDKSPWKHNKYHMDEIGSRYDSKPSLSIEKDLDKGKVMSRIISIKKKAEKRKKLLQ